MRIKLKRGKQRELVLKSKNGKTWDELAKIIGLNPHYISNEIFNEKCLMRQEIYLSFCKIANKKYDEFIEEKLEENWGMKLGGTKSLGNTKEFPELIENESLAELIGAILGDGHIEEYVQGKKVRNYSLDIVGHLEKDHHYLTEYLSEIIKNKFNEKPKIKKIVKENAIHIIIHGKNMVHLLKDKGLPSGNKKKNNVGIPDWIKRNQINLKACLRGLVDTDGSVHFISKNNTNLRITFTSYIPKLMNDVRESFIILGFHPSNIIKGNQIFLTRKEDISKYIQDIGFRNKKHLKRLEALRLELP